ncbi:hypothetical protein BJ875DRAFT_508831, partial [Amylocarpus encephaloides]
GGQVVFSSSGDRDDVEDTITASLQTLCSTLLIELEKPGSHFGVRLPCASFLSPPLLLPTSLSPSPQQPVEAQSCNKTIAEYHGFLAATVKFLNVVQERQMIWRWGHESAVKDGVGWLQSLWASSRPNSQHLSFIQQQLALYDTTGCFGTTKEVLRRSVEVVEYLNDLIDEFN